jgi:hypothetical protein
MVSASLASKPAVKVSGGLSSKPVVTVSPGLASKLVTMVFSGLASKLVAMIFSDLTLKPVAMVFLGLALKPVATVFSGLASKSVAMVSFGLASKPMMGFLSELQNQGGGFPGLGLKICNDGLVIWASKLLRRFLGLRLKTKQASVCRLRHKTDERATVWDTRRDLAACFM